MSENNIVTKNYKKLAVQIALNRLSFCVFDSLTNHSREIHEVQFNNTQSLEDQLWRAFVDFPQLNKTYDDVIVLHDNSLNTFVPKALFDVNALGGYLQYNTKVFETDYFASDIIEPYEIINVHVPYVNVNNFLVDQFGSFDFKNINSVLTVKLLELSRNKFEKQVFVHFQKNHFEIIVADNAKLVLFNSFEYKTPEDFAYYLLFTLEQLQLNPEVVSVALLGEIEEADTRFQIAYRYIRNLTLLDTASIADKFAVTESQALNHFILLHACE
ncbi:DUF3822 family protein [Flavobacterium sp.]|uniref:DUF3822 family protein n=1 Tax=Flavobacterium sp. TaxID=239 RepID=UPI0028BE91A4|nr:DUF3822 family protein [Flavobacterium sp.]